jgi:copper chaperone CopZ
MHICEIRESKMNKIKILLITMVLVIFSLNSSPSFGNDSVTKNVTNSVNMLCQGCKDTNPSALENLKGIFSISKSFTAKKINPVKKYLGTSSPISQDIAHLPHLQEDRGKEIIFLYPLHQF